MKKKILAIVLSIAMSLAFVVALTGCGYSKGGSQTEVIVAQSISINAPQTSYAGENIVFGVVLYPSNATCEVVFSISASDVRAGASIGRGNGIFTATTKGTFTVAATAGSVSAVHEINIVYPSNVTEITVLDRTATVVTGFARLQATVYPRFAMDAGDLIFELVDNPIGASFYIMSYYDDDDILRTRTIYDKLVSSQVGDVTFRARVGTVVSELATVLFEANPRGGETILTVDDFDNIRNNLNGTFQLGRDIDLSDISNWQPIGTYENPFTGVLNGNGRIISGLSIDSNLDAVGLFGVIASIGPASSGTVRDLVIYDASIIGADNVGMAVGLLRGGVVSGIATSGTISGNDFVGGVVGQRTNGRIFDNTNEAIVVGNVKVGGILGFGHGNMGLTIQGSENTGVIGGANFVGGIAGKMLSGEVHNSKNLAAVAGSGNMVGGIVGELSFNIWGQAVVNVVNDGNISGNDYVGGIIGRLSWQGDDMIARTNTGVAFSSNSGVITGSGSAVGGIAGFASSRRFGNLVFRDNEILSGQQVVGSIGDCYNDVCSCACVCACYMGNCSCITDCYYADCDCDGVNCDSNNCLDYCDYLDDCCYNYCSCTCLDNCGYMNHHLCCCVTCHCVIVLI